MASLVTNVGGDVASGEDEVLSPGRAVATSVESFFDDELTSGEDDLSEDEFVDARDLSQEINLSTAVTPRTRQRLSSFDDEPGMLAVENVRERTLPQVRAASARSSDRSRRLPRSLTLSCRTAARGRKYVTWRSRPAERVVWRC